MLHKFPAFGKVWRLIERMEAEGNNRDLPKQISGHPRGMTPPGSAWLASFAGERLPSTACNTSALSWRLGVPRSPPLARPGGQ
jgi:hypothetical protein